MLKKCLLGILAGLITYWVLPSVDHFDAASIKGKKVLVTGASSGIGEEVAYHYARLGASVVITARREDRLKKVIEKCKKLGDSAAKFSYVPADMANIGDTKRVITEAASLLGGLDHLILNHAIYDHSDYWYGTDEQLLYLERMFRVNFMSYVHLTSHALPYLEKSERAAIGVVGSVSGKIPLAFFAAYSATKFALDGFFGAFRDEQRLAQTNITTTLCVIGGTKTDKAVELSQDLAARLNTKNWDAFFEWIPHGVPEDAAWAVLRSTTLGEQEVYYPPGQNIRTMVYVRHLFPGLLQYVTDGMFAGVSKRKTSDML